MQSRSWIKLLQRIPPEQHDTLVLATTIGVEISIQAIFRMEEDYLVARGRMSGTTDNGRIFFIPFDQITYVGIVKEVKEAEIRALLGDAPKLAPAVQRILDTPSPIQAEPEPPPVAAPPPLEPAAAPSSTTPAPAKPGGNLAIPRRSGLIARLRARTHVTTPPGAPPGT